MITLLKKYLHINGYVLQKDAFEDMFLSHPNYPSIYAITDTLETLSIENLAVRIDKDQFNDLPNSFLAIYNGDLVLIHKNKNSITIEFEVAKPKITTVENFKSGWEEIIIVIEANTKVSSNKMHLNTGLRISYFVIIAFLIVILAKPEYNIFSIIIAITTTIGLIISFLLTKEKFGEKNEFVTKLCNFNYNMSCNTVINSDQNSINKWLSLSDVSLLFFCSSSVVLLINLEISYKVIEVLSCITLPFILYTLWLQKFKIKKWCTLCLAISFLIILQSSLIYFENFSLKTINITNFYPFIFTLIIITPLWLYIKPVLEKNIKLTKENLELRRIKRDFSVFEFLSKEINEFDGYEKLKGIEFGNPNAAIRITLILSPSCRYCHKAFIDSYKLYQNYSDKVYLNILFNINPENSKNIYKPVVEHLLTLNTTNPQKAKEAIIDWHIKQLNLENWKRKWIQEIPSLISIKQIQAQYSWCLKNEFHHTPVKIINEKLFPEAFEISDLKYFKNNFQEEIEKKLKII